MYKQLALFLGISWGLAQTAAASFFTGVGDLDGGGIASWVQEVADDGLIAAGYSHTGTYEGFYWNPVTGMTGMGHQSSQSPVDFASSLSPDGTVAGGYGSSDYDNGWMRNYNAYQWSPSNGLSQLVSPDESARMTNVNGIAVGGSVIVGRGIDSVDDDRDYRVMPHYWTPQDGPVAFDPIPDSVVLTTNPIGQIEDVSASGNRMVGSVSNVNGEEFYFEYEMDGTVTTLATLPGQVSIDSISSDGSVILGNAWIDEEDWIVYYGPDRQPTLLDAPKGFNAYDGRAAAGGSVIVGSGWDETTSFAFHWDEAHGFRRLKDVLIDDYGLGNQVAGWELHDASSISADGLTIGGYGFNPDGDIEGFVVRLDPGIDVPVLSLMPSYTAGGYSSFEHRVVGNGQTVSNVANNGYFHENGLLWITQDSTVDNGTERAISHMAASNNIGSNHLVQFASNTDPDLYDATSTLRNTWWDYFLISEGEGSDIATYWFELSGLIGDYPENRMSFLVTRTDLWGNEAGVGDVILDLTLDGESFGGDWFELLLPAVVDFTYDVPFKLTVDVELFAHNVGYIDFSNSAVVQGIDLPDGASLHSSALMNGQIDASVYGLNNSVPVPSSLLLMCIALVPVAGRRRFRGLKSGGEFRLGKR